jgi:sarcosine oxidase subunit gamma
MRLTGAGALDVLTRLCAVDLRPSHLGKDQILQTRLGPIEAVLLPCEQGYEFLFDITTTASMLESLAWAERQSRRAFDEAGGSV